MIMSIHDHHHDHSWTWSWSWSWSWSSSWSSSSSSSSSSYLYYIDGECCIEKTIFSSLPCFFSLRDKDIVTINSIFHFHPFLVIFFWKSRLKACLQRLWEFDTAETNQTCTNSKRSCGQLNPTMGRRENIFCCTQVGGLLAVMPSQTFSRKGIHLLGPSFIMFPEKVQQSNFTTLLFWRVEHTHPV